MHLHVLDYVLWIAAPCLQGCLLFFLRRRELSAQLPVFYRYTLFQVVTDLCLLSIERYSYVTYFYSYWLITAITVLFTFALIDELFRLSFRHLTALRDLGSRVFRWGVALLLIASCFSVLSTPEPQRFADASALILNVDRGARAMLCMLAFLLLLGSRKLRIPARGVLFGISLGFVVYMGIRVLVDSIALLRIGSDHFYSRVNSAAYLSACLLWLAYAMYGEAAPAGEDAPPLAGLEGFSRRREPTLIDAINAVVEKSMRPPAKDGLKRGS